MRLSSATCFGELSFAYLTALVHGAQVFDLTALPGRSDCDVRVDSATEKASAGSYDLRTYIGIQPDLFCALEHLYDRCPVHGGGDFIGPIFLRYLQRESNVDLLIGTSFAVVATLSRQIALCLPFAFGVTLWLKHGFQRRSIICAVFPSTICVVFLAVLLMYLEITGKPSPNERMDVFWAIISQPKRIPARVISAIWNSWGALMYLGWFLSPLLVPSISRRRRLGPGASLCSPASIALLVFVIVSSVRMFSLPLLMPVQGNIIAREGIGPAALRDTYFLRLPHLPALPMAFWLIVTVVSVAGGAVLVFKTTRSIAELFPNGRFPLASADALAQVFFLLCAVIYLGPFLVSGVLRDRYVFPVMAFGGFDDR